jgi:release factor glutamine methyltransferase
MLTLREIKARTEPFFIEKGVPNPVLDLDLLLAHALKIKRLDLYLDLDRPLTEAQLEILRELVKRRAAREPLQYIIGSVEFGGLNLAVDSRALIPRPETEELLEWITTQKSIPKSILDLGTGSGALALTLARAYPEAKVCAVDASPQALELACENAARNALQNRVSFLEGNWWDPLPLDASFDLIVSNPPYLTEDELATAAAEVANHEPRQALVAGSDGLDDLRILLARAADFLEPEGIFVLETGIAQAEALKGMAETAGLEGKPMNDLSGRPRFFVAQHAC